VNWLDEFKEVQDSVFLGTKLIIQNKTGNNHNYSKAKAYERRAKLIKLAPVFQKMDNAIGWSRIGIQYL